MVLTAPPWHGVSQDLAFPGCRTANASAAHQCKHPHTSLLLPPMGSTSARLGGDIG